jgi:hypothetical protein
LLNSGFSVRQAEAMAKRVLAEAGNDRNRQIDVAFRLALQRLPDEMECRLADRFFSRVTQESTSALPVALVQWCQALVNVNEFVYLE